jgi:Fic family protein
MHAPPPQATRAAVPYAHPGNWIAYNRLGVADALIEAKAAVKALTALPHQRDWLEKLQEIQLKMEVAGTSRIEGADFTEVELDAALSEPSPTEGLLTRSQRQARAAVQTYRWIATLPDDYPISEDLVREVHRRMVTGCDDDHCAPGQLRAAGQHVVFGLPMHRGCDGGEACAVAFRDLIRAVGTEYKYHDPLIQAIALHYHFAAMHPFLDGNGRTARGLEALLLQRAGLRDTAFIAMSNYYYDEKSTYLSVLAQVRSLDHDLTPLVLFCLKGVAIQCERLFREIVRSVKKALFRNMKLLLEGDLTTTEIFRKRSEDYEKLSSPNVAFFRDMNALIRLRAITASLAASQVPEKKTWLCKANLDWPEQITETDFMRLVSEMPKAKTHTFL